MSIVYEEDENKADLKGFKDVLSNNNSARPIRDKELATKDTKDKERRYLDEDSEDNKGEVEEGNPNTFKIAEERNNTKY